MKCVPKVAREIGVPELKGRGIPASKGRVERLPRENGLRARRGFVATRSRG